MTLEKLKILNKNTKLKIKNINKYFIYINI